MADSVIEKPAEFNATERSRILAHFEKRYGYLGPRQQITAIMLDQLSLQTAALLQDPEKFRALMIKIFGESNGAET